MCTPLALARRHAATATTNRTNGAEIGDELQLANGQLFCMRPLTWMLRLHQLATVVKVVPQQEPYQTLQPLELSTPTKITKSLKPIIFFRASYTRHTITACDSCKHACLRQSTAQCKTSNGAKHCPWHPTDACYDNVMRSSPGCQEN